MSDCKGQQEQLAHAVDDHARQQEAASDGHVGRAKQANPDASRDDGGAF